MSTCPEAAKRRCKGTLNEPRTGGVDDEVVQVADVVAGDQRQLVLPRIASPKTLLRESGCLK